MLFVRALENGRAIGAVHTASARDQKGRAVPFFTPLGSSERVHTVYVPVIARPGKYTLEIALLDRVTGRYNTRYENVAVSGNPKDVIERAFAPLDRFEFAGIPGKEAWEEPLDPFPGFRGRGGPQYSRFGSPDAVSSASPDFVIDRPRPLKLTIFSVLSPPDTMLGQESARLVFQTNLMNLLSPLLRFDVVNGSSDFIALDLEGRSRPFDRILLKDVQSEALRTAISKDRSTVSLKDIVGRPDNGKFLRDALAERLQEASADTSGATHAIIIAGGRAKVPGSQGLEPIPAPRDCHCKVFYVRFPVTRHDKDDMPHLISEYKPRTFQPLTWLEYREQFATIYAQLLQ